MDLQQRFEALARDQFYGVPVENFEFAGREQLTYLLNAGLNPDYKGDQWIGTSHESNVAGTIAHSFGWIKAQCRARELMIRKLGRDKAHRHKWLELGKIG